MLVHRIMLSAFAEYVGHLNPPSTCHAETVGDVAQAIQTGGAILAWVEDQPVGSARYIIHADHVYVGRVSVLPDYRGCGVASAMMRYLETLAHDRGCMEIRLNSRLSLPRNIALYQRLGYDIVATWQVSPDADVQVTMVKRLEQVSLEKQQRPDSFDQAAAFSQSMLWQNHRCSWPSLADSLP